MRFEMIAPAKQWRDERNIQSLSAELEKKRVLLSVKKW